MSEYSRREFLKMFATGLAGLAAGGIVQVPGLSRALAAVAGSGHVTTGRDGTGPILTPPAAPLDLPPWKYGTDSSSRDTVLMFRGSPARNFYGTGPLPANPRLKWSVKLEKFPTRLRGTPVVWAGTGWTGQPVRLGDYVFVAGVDRFLYAIRAADGQIVWKLRLGRMIKSSPCVYENRLFVGCTDNYLRCIDAATGRIVWKFDSGTDMDSSPCVYRGLLYVAGESGYVRCIDPADGRELWKSFVGGIGPGSLPGSNGSETSPAIYDDLLYTATYDGILYCIDVRTGKHVWQAATGADTDASPVISGPHVFTASEEQGSFVTCFDRLTGRQVWRYDGYKRGYWATPAVADGRVFVGTGGGGAGAGMICLDEGTGREIWKTAIGAAIWSSPCVVDGRLVFGCNDGKLYILDARDGTVQWTGRMAGRSISTPCIVDGEIFIGTATGTFHCFGA